MATTYVITIKKHTPKGQLVLSDHDHTRAGKKDKVRWRIKPGSNVESIVKIEKKPGSPEIFSTLPHQNGSNWEGTIDRNARAYTEYLYSISWQGTDTSGTHIYDPKITVKPSTASYFKILVIIIISSLFSVLFITKFFNRKNNTYLSDKGDDYNEF